MYRKSSIKPPHLKYAPPLISPPPLFQGKKGLVISPHPLSPSIKKVQMGQVACLYHHDKGPGILLCCFHFDGVQVQLLISLPICHSLFIFWVECRSEGLSVNLLISSFC